MADDSEYTLTPSVPPDPDRGYPGAVHADLEEAGGGPVKTFL